MIKNRLQGTQRGMSVIGLVITLLIIGYGSYIAIQYVPQLIESQSVNSILDSIQKDHRAAPVESAAEIRGDWDRLLNVNEMNDLKDIIEISNYRGAYTITIAYDRELDLLFKKKTIHYEKKVTLD